MGSIIVNAALNVSANAVPAVRPVVNVAAIADLLVMFFSDESCKGSRSVLSI